MKQSPIKKENPINAGQESSWQPLRVRFQRDFQQELCLGKHLVSMALRRSWPAPGAVPRRDPPSANKPREPGGAGGCCQQQPRIRPITLPPPPGTRQTPGHGVHAGEHRHNRVMPLGHSPTVTRRFVPQLQLLPDILENRF